MGFPLHGGSVMSSVPFRLTGSAQPLAIVQAHVNDQGPFEFILDTGAGTTIVDPPLAERLRLDTGERKMARGAGGEAETHLAVLETIRVGSARLERFDVGVSDLSAIARA